MPTRQRNPNRAVNTEYYRLLAPIIDSTGNNAEFDFKLGAVYDTEPALRSLEIVRSI